MVQVGQRNSSHLNDANPFDALTPTLFHQPWWLHAATNGRYEEVVVALNGRAVGRFPFVIDRKAGFFKLCRMPELTHFLGPAVLQGQGTASNRSVRHMQILRDLIERLPASTSCYHKMHGGITDMLVFQKMNYNISVQFTYEIFPAKETLLWSNMRDKTRNVIRRGLETLAIGEIDDPALFLHHYNLNLVEAGTSNSYRNATILRVVTAALQRGHGRILCARDQSDQVVAAILCVWDSKSSYFLMSTRSRSACNGAVSVLLWNAIRDASARNLVFDFGGVGAAGSILFFSGFGGQTSPRYIARSSTLLYGMTRLAFRPFRPRGREEFF